MRYLILVTLFACSASGAAEMWRWVDSNGVVHYSDQPAPGAEKLTLQSTPRPAAPTATPLPNARTPARQPDFRYTRCAVTSPANDQVFTNEGSVSVSLDLTPAQRPGDRVLVNLNGRRVDNWPESSTSFMLSNLFRGSYTVNAQVVDATGKSLCSSASAFHIRQPSMLTPAGAVPKTPRVPTAPAAPKPPARR